ncbi:3892_t:CDS:2, partial [Acaulospora morrowiae]
MSLRVLLSANPNFAELYEELTTQYLTPDGTTKELSRELNQETYMKDKAFYFETLILYNAVQQLSLQKELSKEKTVDTQRKVLEAIKNVLSFAETKQYIGFRAKDPSLKNNKHTLFGLTEENLRLAVENELQELKISKEYILTSVENKLKEQCEDITKFYYAGEELNPKLIFTKAVHLNKKVNQCVNDLWHSKIDIIANQNQLGEQIVNYMNVMKEILSNLWNVLEEFKLHHEFEKNRIFGDYFSSIIKSIVLKFRVLRFNALLSIYNKDTVERLKIIRDDLLKEETKMCQELNALESELSKYQICDELESIVQIYTK